MKKLLFIIGLLIIVSCNGEPAKAEINIPTAQCGMCAMTIEGALLKVNGVKKANVNMDALKVTVTYNVANTSLENLEGAIANAGYQANEISANVEVYKTLPACCKLPVDR